MKKTIKKRILEIISEKPLSTQNIAYNIWNNFPEDLWINPDNLMSYISTLKKENKVIRVNKKRPYEYLSITPEALLKRFYSIVIDKMPLKEDLNEFENRFTFNIIEEMFKHEII